MGEFRAAFFARDYERSVAFYREDLGLPVLESWDRGPGDRGTMFEAGDGRIEVLEYPEESPDATAVWDTRPPQGVLLVLEQDDVAGLYERVRERGVKLRTPLETQRWGHRSFVVEDPEGVRIYFFEPI